MTTAHRSGFVGVVGHPNVGKSTMVNWFVGSKVAIVSPRPQTTRQRILGILTRQDAQVVFVDTPGFHQPEHALGRYMLEVLKTAMEEADVLLVVIDACRGLNREDQQIFERVRRMKRPAIVAINKVDLVKKPRLLPLIEACAKTGLFADCVPVCALTGEQMEILLARLIHHLPEGPQWYDPSQETDQTPQQRVSELIREQLLLATRQEVPHAIAVLLDEVDDRKSVIAIRATIVVERPGQKAIVIGRHGAVLKSIGQAARQQVERLLGRKVYLELWVKVKPSWRTDARLLQQLGYGG
jgi:GTP-binding protein Era